MAPDADNLPGHHRVRGHVRFADHPHSGSGRAAGFGYCGGENQRSRFRGTYQSRAAKLTGTYTINLFVNGATILDGNQIFVAKASKHFTFSTGKGQAFNFNLKVFPAGIVNGIYHLLAEVTDPNGGRPMSSPPRNP